MNISANIRPFAPSDDLAALTSLLHRAYAPLAEMGLRFSATHQTPETTARRIRSGHCFILEIDGKIAGTITVRPPGPESQLLICREPDVWSFGQFGIEPDRKGLGYGRMLYRHAEAFAIERGAKAMVLDTAAPAHHLIAMYERWGFRIVGRHSWQQTNYESVIMRKDLQGRG